MVKRRRSIPEELADIGRKISRVFFCFYMPLVAVLVLLHYPYDTDQSIYPMPSVEAKTDASRIAVAPVRTRSGDFYEAVYSGPDKNGLQKRQGLNYEETALAAAAKANVREHVAYFVDKYDIKNKSVLEVGSGQGSLQDLVDDYTGLDISAAAASKYHKKFVVASATAMPFPDNSFDAIWTVWVVEHIPEPERAMREMRRVLKPGGKLFLYVAWNCTSWLADGFSVRPYSDFNWKGKMVKASLSARDTGYFKAAHQLPTRLIRWAQYGWNGRTEPLRFRALEPNYTTYWQADSDAAIGLDPFEALLWHRAQGDVCLNCTSMLNALGNPESAWILEIRK